MKVAVAPKAVVSAPFWSTTALYCEIMELAEEPSEPYNWGHIPTPSTNQIWHMDHKSFKGHIVLECEIMGLADVQRFG